VLSDIAHTHTPLRTGALSEAEGLSRSRIPSRGGSHAAGSRAWEPALLQNRDLLGLITADPLAYTNRSCPGSEAPLIRWG
jgi:hypothetical protein